MTVAPTTASPTPGAPGGAVTLAGATAAAVPADGRRGRRGRRGWRWPTAVAAVVLLAAVSGLLLLRPTTTGDLDPGDASPGGARALAHVLRDHGVRVETPRTFVAATAAVTGGPASVVVVSRPDRMSPSRGRDLRELLDRSGADLVLVGPDDTLLSDLRLPVTTTGGTAGDDPRDPACTDDAALRAGRARVGGRLYEITPAGAGSAAACYAGGGRQTPYAAVRDANGARSTVLGDGTALTNDQLATAGDAALAVGLLGRRPQVVWWTPSALDGSTVAEPPSLGELLPAGVRFGALDLVLVLLVVALWRGRRLGRLVPEPLPVVVRAVETTRGRAQLYRRARARGRAAQVLRAATGRRLAVRLGLPRTAGPHEVAALVATRTGRPAADVLHLLAGPDPGDDVSLVLLARELDTLETEVRRP